jgi:Ca-activated chloride channel family protein
MSWAEPVWLAGLVIPVVMILLQLRRRAAGRGNLPAGLKRSDGSRAGSAAPPRRSVYGWLALAALLVALARPQAGYIELPVFKQSRQVMIALDVSKSMLATDISPSRLDRSRLLIETLLDELGQEQVGLILFSGSAFLQCPLSADYEILQELLPEVGPEYLPRGGTNYQEMLAVAGQAFNTTGNADRFLIVLSDGESLVPGWEKEAGNIAELGVQVITLGVGTREGALVPDPEGGFVKNSDGGAVLSRLESSTLEELARLTGGRYVDAARWIDLGDLVQATIEQGKVGEVQESAERIPVERFQIPLACALFFLLMRLWREIPVKPRMVEPAPTGAVPPPVQRPQPARAVAPPPLPVLMLLFSGLAAHAQPQEMPSPVEALAGKVAELSAKPGLGVAEFQDLAQATIGAGGAAPTSLPKGSIEDALDAVQRGRRQDAAYADWDRMEEILRQMLEPPPESEQQSQDQNQESDQEQQSDGGQNSQQSQDKNESGEKQQSSGGESSPENQSEDGESSGEPDPDSEESGEESDPSNEKSQENSGSSGSQSQPSPDDPSSEMGDLSEEQDQAAPEPRQEDAGNQQTVQGSSSGGEIPEGLESDASLRALFSRAEQIKNADQPGLLFQRMQGETDRQAREGKDW